MDLTTPSNKPYSTAGCYESDSFVSYKNSTNDNSISDDAVTSIVEDKKGNLWFGTGHGLNLYQRETDNFKRIKLPSNDIWSLAYDDNNHQLLIGTLSRGLYFLDLNTNEIDNITIDDGLAGESVFCILRDGTDFWASTNVGLSKISADKTITNFYWRHGLQDGYNYNSCASSKVGELFFGGGTGLSYFYPKNLKTDTTVPVVHITRLSLYDAKSNRFNHFKMGDAKPLFSYEQNNINIEFTGIYYTAPDKLAYEYRLLN
ncbi:MAG: hypothetical protein HRT35_29300, partial [Algicola sp.]|nr:hypothetical protein [Algicola sp.]